MVLKRIKGFDDCIIGFGESSNRPVIAVYNYNKLIDKIKHGYSLDRKEAIEFYKNNILSDYMGEASPMFIKSKDHEE